MPSVLGCYGNVITNVCKCVLDENGKVPRPCCPKTWTQSGEDGRERCYKYFDSPKTWAQAEGYCQWEGGHLASISCEKTSHFLQTLTRGNSHDFPLSWVGGHNAVQSCLWSWSDGQFFNFENFYDPKCKERENSCLRINYKYQLKWSSGNCNETLPFVCVKDTECESHC